MSQVIVVQQPAQNQQSNQPTSLWGFLGNILKIVIPIIVIIFIFIALGLSFIIIDNWDYIATFFTTGFIGWLNPFDDPDGDRGPLGKTGGTIGAVLGGIPFFGPALSWPFRKLS